MYLFRVSCGVYGLIGIFFIMLAKDPLNYGPMLYVGAYGLIIFGLLSLIVGGNLEITPKVYTGDFLTGSIFGVAIIVLSSKAKKALNK